jgi:RNA polymerase sigma factor (sigma-70 family)
MAIDMLYKKVFPQIKIYIKNNRGNKEQAEDIFHDAIIKLIVKVRNKELGEESDLYAYLFVMAKNMWIVKAKRDQKVQFVEEVVESGYDAADSEDVSESGEKTKAMEEALSSIGEKCKELLMLTFYLNYSLKEAAEKLGISNEEVAKTNQYRCKKKLFEVIKSNSTFRELMNG